MTHDFKAVIDWVNQERQSHIENRGHSDIGLYLTRYDTIIAALRIADKLIDEPSEDMLVASGATPKGVTPRGGVDYTRKMLPVYFTAMRDQMLKELEEENNVKTK